MSLKRAVLMTGAVSFFLGLAGVFSCSMSGQCSGCGGSPTSSPSQSLERQCNNLVCFSQVTCQYRCQPNPNMPSGPGQMCPSGY